MWRKMFKDRNKAENLGIEAGISPSVEFQNCSNIRSSEKDAALSRDMNKRDSPMTDILYARTHLECNPAAHRSLFNPTFGTTRFSPREPLELSTQELP
jgi:hypothetical protein